MFGASCRNHSALDQNYPQYRKAGYKNIDVYARGSKVAPIDGGLFDINALLTVQ